jgi:hypothetical protein
MNRSECLDKAKEIVNGARQENYGKPERNFNQIACYWSLYLDHDVSATDVALMMVLMKLARLQNKPDHDDSWIDIAGYAANGAEIATYRNEVNEAFDKAFFNRDVLGVVPDWAKDEKDSTKADKEKLDAFAESRDVCCGG